MSRSYSFGPLDEVKYSDISELNEKCKTTSGNVSSIPFSRLSALDAVASTAYDDNVLIAFVYSLPIDFSRGEPDTSRVAARFGYTSQLMVHPDYRKGVKEGGFSTSSFLRFHREYAYRTVEACYCSIHQPLLDCSLPYKLCFHPINARDLIVAGYGLPPPSNYVGTFDPVRYYTIPRIPSAQLPGSLLSANSVSDEAIFECIMAYQPAVPSGISWTPSLSTVRKFIQQCECFQVRKRTLFCFWPYQVAVHGNRNNVVFTATLFWCNWTTEEELFEDFPTALAMLNNTLNISGVYIHAVGNMYPFAQQLQGSGSNLRLLAAGELNLCFERQKLIADGHLPSYQLPMF